MWKQRSRPRCNRDPSAVAGIREGQNIHSIVVSTYYAARCCYAAIIIIYVSTVEKIAGNDSVATLRFLRRPNDIPTAPERICGFDVETLNTGNRI